MTDDELRRKAREGRDTAPDTRPGSLDGLMEQDRRQDRHGIVSQADGPFREAVKHPERMGPLGDAPERPSPAGGRQPRAGTVQEDAQVADRQQFTTSE
jgi:hypothetical protein